MKNYFLVMLMLSATASLSFAAEKTPDTIKRVDTLIAVFDIEVSGKVDKDVAQPLSDSIRREIMMAHKYEVIDRSNMDKILKEQSFQMTGCTTKDCAVEAGQMLGVGKIVVGRLSSVGKMYYLSLSLVNVQTGKTEAVEEDKCLCEIEELIDSSKRAANKLMATPSAKQTDKIAVSTAAKRNETLSQPGGTTGLIGYFSLPKIPLVAGVLGILPGVGNYYVGSFGDKGASTWVTQRGIIYTVALGAAVAGAGKPVTVAAVLCSIVDATYSAASYNDYYKQRVKTSFDYNPQEKAGMFKVSYSF